MFTELDPAGLQDNPKDEQGNEISLFEAELSLIMSSFNKNGERTFNLKEVEEPIDHEKLMKRQEMGDFKLTRKAYL